jgi:RNA polymerase sigma-70 factor (ECF subfamily)
MTAHNLSFLHTQSEESHSEKLCAVIDRAYRWGGDEFSMGPFRPHTRIPIVMILAASMDPNALTGVVSAVERLRRGDLNALPELMDPYQHRLYRFLLRLSQDPALAEDLFQQTWLRVMEKIRHFDARRNFDAWLFSVARNLTIDHLRRRRDSSLNAPDNSGTAPVDRLVAVRANPLEQLLEYERGELLAAAVSTLPFIHREVLTLRFEEEMMLEDIAEVIQIPLSTVKSRLSRALESLRGRMERQ